MDGFELTRELKSDERTSHVPVVLLTARTDHDSRITGLEYGADDYLAKPFNVQELITRINNLIATRRQLQRRYAQMVVSVEPQAADLPEMETEFLVRLRQAIEERISDEDFRVEEMASALNVSRRQLQRKIRALTGESPSGLLRRIRLEHAAKLLIETSINVSEAAPAVGFSSPSYFAQCFRDQFGQSPTEYVTSAS
jgi:transcriptional regulator GlxA family with amidase domain